MKRLLIFNSTCELAVGNGDKNYTPPDSLIGFERDLALLMLVFADKQDVVFGGKHLTNNEVDYFNWLFGKQCSFFDKLNVSEDYLPIPWGFAPNLYPFLNRENILLNKCFADSLFGSWREPYRDFFSRLSAVKLLNASTDFLSNLSFKPSFNPTVVSSFDELRDLVPVGHDFVVKNLWSASGRGVFISVNGKLTLTHTNIITRIFKLKHSVVVEPFFNRVEDFSMQFEIDGSLNVLFKGVSFFETNKLGHYLGSKLNYNTDVFLERYPTLFNSLSLNSIANEMACKLAHLIKTDLSSPFYNTPLTDSFRFPFGVDMMVYLNEKNEFLLHPCIEINWRHTMGLVALKLSESIHKHLVGRFVVSQICDWQKKCESRFAELDLNQKPFALPGFYPLTSWTNGEVFGAFIELTEQ